MVQSASPSLILVSIGSKFMTNNVFVCIILARELLELPDRPTTTCSCCVTNLENIKQNTKPKIRNLLSCVPLSSQREAIARVCQTQSCQGPGLHPLHLVHHPCKYMQILQILNQKSKLILAQRTIQLLTLQFYRILDDSRVQWAQLISTLFGNINPFLSKLQRD